MEFNGWNFDHAAERQKMRYLVVMDGDLDLNNAYAFKSLKDLRKYMKEESGRKTLAVFKVHDMTPNDQIQRAPEAIRWNVVLCGNANNLEKEMAREVSDATKLRNAMRELNEMRGSVRDEKQLANEYRARATKAEQEASEWKRRFDLLLERSQIVTAA